MKIVEYFTWKLPRIEKFRQYDVRMSASAQISHVFGQRGESQGVRGQCQTAAGPTKQIHCLSIGTSRTLSAAESARM